jgi:hypothetical protein
VRFSGVFVPTKEQNQKGLLDDLDVRIGRERWILLLNKMEIVGSTGLNRSTLQRVFPRSLRFVGPDDLIHPLESPNIAGQILIIEGFLYTASRILLVTAVYIDKKAGTLGEANLWQESRLWKRKLCVAIQSKGASRFDSNLKSESCSGDK